MNFVLSDDVVAVRDGLRVALRANCTPDLVRAVSSPEGDERLRDLWKLLGDLGVLGLLVPEAQGGLGSDEILLAVALEEVGYVAGPGPIAEVISLTAPTLAESADQAGLFQKVLAGEAIVACSTNESLVPYAQVSDAVLFVHDDHVELATRADVIVTPLATVDGSRRAGSVVVNATPMVLSSTELPRARERATLAAAAELVGLSARMLDMTTEYVQSRRQFGVAIGSFQAVKHALANSLITIEFARPAVWRAALSLSNGDLDAAAHVSMAKALASDAARQVAKTSIQCHGAMGYTVEYDLQLFAKRAWARCADWGDSEQHIARVADWLPV
jgi:alkylation response protein AidB-like acyl-CoA dehydrogenase